MSAPPAPSKSCYNSHCTELRPDRPRKGWRLRTGEFAELCDRCASLYEEGRFCETFHSKASGWRDCESCGKTASPAWPASLFFHASSPDRLKDHPVKLNQLAGSGPVPWRQAPSLFNSCIPRPELHPRSPYEVDGSINTDRLLPRERYAPLDFSERLMNGSVKQGPIEKYENGHAALRTEEHQSCFMNNPQHSVSLKEEPSTPQFGLATSYALTNETNGHLGVAGPQFRPAPPPTLAKHFYGNMLHEINSPVENQIRNGRPRGDVRGKNQLLPRYWPRITDQELQQISGDSNSVITPLFEKMLSASDAGKVGRLVLPKKCAEAYFPPISQPEGLPLKVQDAKGSEWTFQFRFWPNNNSRMYVLEGVTPCIQSMQLQAGDIVTFSRLEPEGKLIMGFRKASAALPSDQENEAGKTVNGVPGQVGEAADPSSWSKVDKSGYVAKDAPGAKISLSRKRKNSTLGLKNKRLRIDSEDLIELKLTWEEAQGLLRPPPDHAPSIVVIEGFEFEEYEDAPVLGKPTIFATDNGGEKIQWVQCEDCLKWRKVPVDSPLPSKWTCAENKWDPERSSCSAAQELTSEELEDLLRSSNSAASKKLKAPKEETAEALEGLDTLANLAILGEEGDGTQTSSSQATTKHPRHRPGCSCIVCIQPPSGKGPKHKQTCTCNVCLTVKRRFKTLMMRREKRQSEKEAEGSGKKQQDQVMPMPDKSLEEDLSQSNSSPSLRKVTGHEGSDEDLNKMKTSDSPFRGQIDLNIQPEREDEMSPGSDSGSGTLIKPLDDATEGYLVQGFPPSDENRNPSGDNATGSGHQEAKVPPPSANG
ncbi:B3 domain-containing protein Os07g0563300 isoform X2 [Punica granatum]|uniref:B3 domain-containing protein Os07g0563300 isoform X2 n=1 Tax=Punica granatum TaxID=22663 RepID=A0A6P8D9K2_PUNGR|nr:B3 domain-containing protein Os07g0563300 isoform X2 [Punica granatum]